MIPFSNPIIGDLEKKWVAACLESGYVSSVGPLIEPFEQAFARQVGARYAVATASGTAALHVALRVLNIGAHDPVVVPDLTFVASLNPALYAGAEPVLADVSADRWTLNPDLLRALCRHFEANGRRIAAVVPVHLYGCACDMDAIRQVAETYDLRIIEDATEALGTTLRGKQVGTFGDVGCFSFNGNKMITTGGGGMLVTDNPAWATRARHLVNQARLSASDYVHDEMGYNYRMTNLTAALGLAQMERLPALLARKKAIGLRYRSALEQTAAFQCMPEQPEVANCYWLYSIALRDPAHRDAWMRALSLAGIPSRKFFVPLHRQPYVKCPLWTFHDDRLDTRPEGVSDRLALGGLNLPSSPDMTDAQQDQAIDQLLRLARA